MSIIISRFRKDFSNDEVYERVYGFEAYKSSIIGKISKYFNSADRRLLTTNKAIEKIEILLKLYLNDKL